MKSEDLDAFERFEIWHFDDSSAYLLAGTKLFQKRKAFCGYEVKKITSSFPVERIMPETFSVLSKEEAFSMLCDYRFPAD